MSRRAGECIGAYELGAQLGAGGMGEVYRATDRKLKRQVAIKLLPADLAANVERLARLQREAEVLAQLNHPNIAVVHGLEEADGIKALVMELVEGPTLADRIAQGALPLDEALSIARQISKALEAAHEQGIIHRDLKPANIKLRPDGTVKVLDFGIAKVLESAPHGAGNASHVPLSLSPTVTTPAMTGAGIMLGTAAYMAPEQARGRPIDKRADIWAFGVVLYEMLTGAPPFTGDDVAEVVAQVLTKQPDLARVPAEARRLVDACLQKDPRERLRDIGDALRLIEAGGEPGVASPRPRRRLLPKVVVGTLAAALTLVSVLHFRETPEVLRLDLAAEPGNELMFRISPGGRQVVIRTSNRLYVRDLNSGNEIKLPETEGASYPFWSRDGKEIGFFANGKLKRTAATGGAVIPICDAPNGRGASWGLDDIILFTRDLNDAIYQVSISTGQVQAVTDAGGGRRDDRFPEFLPDGRRFVFLGLGRDSETTGIYAGVVGEKNVVRILPDQSSAMYVAAGGFMRQGYLLFRRDDTLVAQAFDPDNSRMFGPVIPVSKDVTVFAHTGYGAFAASPAGTVVYLSGPRFSGQVVKLNRRGERLDTFTTEPHEMNGSRVAVSPDGSAAAYTLGNVDGGRARIWVHNLVRGIPSQLPSGPRGSGYPIWSPGSDRILFQSHVGSGYRLELQAAGGKGPETVLEGDNLNTVRPTDWSQTRNVVVYSNRNPRTKDDIWLLPMDGTRTPVEYLATEKNESEGMLSPDGNWMAYVSDENERNEVYVRHVPDDRSTVRMSSKGGSQPRWSRDSHELYYLVPNPNGNPQMMAVTFKAGAAFEPGAATVLFDHLPIYSIAPLPGSPDFIAIVGEDGADQPRILSVVLNWQPGR